MKLIDAINNVDRSESDSWMNREPLYAALGLDYFYDSDQANDGRLKEYWLQKWQCTDTWVGLRVVFFDNKPVATIWQVARKSVEEVEFLSEEQALKLRQYLVTEDKPQFSLVDLNEEINEFYTVEYNSQLLTDRGFYNGEEVTVVDKKFNYSDPSSEWSKIKVKNSCGVELRIDLSEFMIPLNLKKD
jgi:hypothetical protein